MFIIPKVTNVGVPDPHGIRTIVFSDAFEKAGVNSGTMTRLSVPGFKLLRHIASSTPTEEDLIDGAIYTFSLEYQDRQQNAKAVVNHTDITYAGVDTLAPVFYLLPQVAIYRLNSISTLKFWKRRYQVHCSCK